MLVLPLELGETTKFCTFHNLRWSGLVQRLSQVPQDVVNVFDADGESHKVWRDAGGQLLLGRKLLVGRRGRMDGQRFGIAHVGQVRKELQALDEAPTGLRPALDAKAQDSALSPGQVLLGQFVRGMVWQAGVRDPTHLGMTLQELGHRLGVATVLLHPQREGF